MPAPTHRLTDAPDLCRLIDRPVTAVVATTSPEGHPQTSVVWLERRGDELVFFASVDAIKVRNLSRTPLASVVVLDPSHELAPGVPVYAQMTGSAVVGPEEPGMVERLARAYGQVEGWQGGDGPFCTVHVHVTRISGVGPRPRRTMGGWGPARDAGC